MDAPNQACESVYGQIVAMTFRIYGDSTNSSSYGLPVEIDSVTIVCASEKIW